jgi:predicted acetyltransferase
MSTFEPIPTPAGVYDLPRDESDWEAVAGLVIQSFNVPADRWPSYRDRVGPHVFRVLRTDQGVEACLGMDVCGQFFGGRPVSMAAIAVVATAPEARGTGRSAGLLGAMLGEARGRGIGMSTLYPAAQGPYRKVGYEPAGMHLDWKAATKALPVGPADMPVTRVPTDDPAVFERIWRRRLPASNGWLDRNRANWLRVLRPRNDLTYGYVFGDPAAPRGYTLFKHNSGADPHYTLEVQDHLALDAASARRIWSFYAGHRSIAGAVEFVGAPHDLMIATLPEQAAKIDDHITWMSRLVDLPGAMAARGWPSGLAIMLDLEVEDPDLPENAGAWRLEVGGGEGRLVRSGPAAEPLRAHIRGLAALFTGFRDPWTLRGAGLLDGPPAALERAAALFAGPLPCMTDYF